MDEVGSEVAPGETGELVLRGACVTEGYYRDVAPGPDAEGWLATGDMARANAEGMVWVVDRKKDMINRGGEKVWCSALEEVVCELPFVSACWVSRSRTCASDAEMPSPSAASRIGPVWA